MLKLPDRSVVSECRATLLKRETKMIGGVNPLPIRCLSQFFLVEEKTNRLRNEVLCVCLRIFHR